MAGWYLSYGGKKQGPYEASQAADVAKLNPNGYAWAPGFTEWLPISQVAELSSDASPAPPAPPPASTGADEIDFKIMGTEMQFVEIELDPGDHAGTQVELWVGVLTFYGAFWCQETTGAWTGTMAPYSYGSLNAIPMKEVLNQPPPLGLYHFFIVLDSVPNGYFDYGLGDHALVICSQ